MDDEEFCDEWTKADQRDLEKKVARELHVLLTRFQYDRAQRETAVIALKKVLGPPGMLMHHLRWSSDD